MSKIEFYMRPLVAFDATLKEHRGYYYEYLKKRSWGWCPYRFIVPDGTSNLVSEIQQKLLAYYVQKEFKTKGKTVVQKTRKRLTQPKKGNTI